MSNASSHMTNTVGFYNGHRWPIQLVISKLNITLTLEPGKYILDRQGRKINDPYFDVFVNSRQLHRETSKTPVPLICIPVVSAPARPASASVSPVQAVTEWTRDARGMRQPVMPQPAPQPEALPPAVAAAATESVRPMSMEEARRLGFVRKVREVPEDYGVSDTTGLPPSNIPKMKYAIDPSVNRQVKPLAKEMLALPKDDPNRQTRAQLFAGLSKGTSIPAPEDAEGAANPFANTAVVNVPSDSPIVAGTPAPIMEDSPSEAETVAEGLPEELLPEPFDDLPAPVLPEAAPAGTSVPATAAPASPATAPALRPMTPANKFVCMACGAPFKFRSQLQNHALAKHPANANAIMAAYPVAAPSAQALP